MSGPLSGIRIIDLTNVIMGPFATHILADMGADVIKIESAEGDSIRTCRPYRGEGMSGAFLHLNRNKRSVTLDLESARGQEATDRLLAGADVFVHALRPRTIRSLGYHYDRVRGVNPDIVHCGAYGFSAGGPYADEAAYDDIIRAGCGMAALCAQLHGEPTFIPTVVCDRLAGQAIACSILAALFARERRAGGQAIEVPMFETAIEFALLEHLGGFAFEPPLSKPGFARLMSVWRRPFRTADGWCCILPCSTRNWRDVFAFVVFAFVGCDAQADDPRFATLRERVQHIETLYRLIDDRALAHHGRAGGVLQPLLDPLHAGPRHRGPARGSACARGRPFRHGGASDRGPVQDDPPPRHLLRPTLRAASPRAAAGGAHGRNPRGDRDGGGGGGAGIRLTGRSGTPGPAETNQPREETT